MMQATRSATEARRKSQSRAASSFAPSIVDFGEVMGAGASLDAFRNSKEQMETIRFQQSLMQAEELAIRKMRNAEIREGGILLQVFGIGKAYGGIPGSKLLHPQSPFASVWLILSALLLVYSALCSSFYVGFLWQSSLCETPPPTLYFDMFVDVFFLVEIGLNFFTGTTIAGEYNDSLPEVALHYLFRGTFVGGFFFDLGTSIPVSFVEYVLLQKCEAMLATGGEFNAGILRIMRTSKALRVARLLRAIKVIARLKSIMEFVAFIGDYLRIPAYVLRVLKILMMIAMLVHLCTCTWWLIKTESNASDVLHDYLAAQDLGLAPHEDLGKKYVMSFYFVNTVFCTIGFGDISGSNSTERLFCVFLFYTGVFVFGSLLVEVQEAIGEARQARREREREINQMVEFLRSEDVPRHLERQMAKWADFGMRAMQKFQGRKRVMDMVPSHLRRHLLTALHRGLLSTVPLFMRMDSFFREDLQLDLWERMTPKVYSPFTAVAADGFGQNFLYVICCGTVILQRGRLVVATLHTGDSFDEDWLLLDMQELQEDAEVEAHAAAAAVPQRKHCSVTDPVAQEHSRYVAVTDVLCMCLSKKDFESIVDTYDDSVTSYFDAERKRRRGAAALRRRCMDSQESDSNAGDAAPSAQDDGASAAPRVAANGKEMSEGETPMRNSARISFFGGSKNKSKQIQRTWSHDTTLLRGQVARERWILLTRRAYRKLYLSRHTEMAESMQADARREVWRRAYTRIRGHHVQHPKRSKYAAMRRTSSANDVSALCMDEEFVQRVLSEAAPASDLEEPCRTTKEWVDKLQAEDASAAGFAGSFRDRLNPSGGAWHSDRDLCDIRLTSAPSGEDGATKEGGCEGIVVGLKQDVLRMYSLLGSVMARIEALEQHQQKGQEQKQESASHRSESTSGQDSARDIARGHRNARRQHASSPDAAAAAAAAAPEPAAPPPAAEDTYHIEMVHMETEGRVIMMESPDSHAAHAVHAVHATPAPALAPAHLAHADAAHATPATVVQGAARSPGAVTVANPPPLARGDALLHGDALHHAPLTSPARPPPPVWDADGTSVMHREGWSKQAENIRSLKSELETMKQKLGAVRESP